MYWFPIYEMQYEEDLRVNLLLELLENLLLDEISSSCTNWGPENDYGGKFYRT